MSKSKNNSMKYKSLFMILSIFSIIVLILNILGLSNFMTILPILKIDRNIKKVLKKIYDIVKDKEITEAEYNDINFNLNSLTSKLDTSQMTYLSIYSDILTELQKIKLNRRHKNVNKALKELSKIIDNPTNSNLGDYFNKKHFSEFQYIKNMMKLKK